MPGTPAAGPSHRISTLDRRRRTALLALAGVVAVATGVADRLTGPDLSLLLFYLVPVAIVAWLCSTPVALGVALGVALEGVVVALATPDGGPDAVQIWNAAARTVFYLLVAVLVGGQRRLTAELRAQASTDHLTGALNRAALYEATERILARARRTGETISVVYFDLDGLKRANDERGHEAGDALIARAASAARTVLRPDDLLARLGGDEFAVVLTGTDRAQARGVVDRIVAELGRPVEGGPVSASFGIWTERSPSREPDELIHGADTAMYRAKRSAHERVCVAGPDLPEQAAVQRGDPGQPPAPAGS